MSHETAHIVNAMYRTGQGGVIAQWKAGVEAWAEFNRTDPNAVAVNAWLPLWQPRPFYSAEELAPMWPALAIATGFTNEWPAVVKSARRLAHELDFHGLPRLGRIPKYRDHFIVERIGHWKYATEKEIVREIEHAFG